MSDENVPPDHFEHYDHAQLIALTKRTAVVRIDLTKHDPLVGAAQSTITITEPCRG